jgi:hypothetical protein
VLGALWAFTAGPLAGRLVTMDAAWLEVLASKDYLFPTDWPLYAWILNLGYLPAILVFHGLRRRAGQAGAGEGALVVGLAVLFLLFAISVPLTWWKLAVAVQFQVTRVFWIMDAVLAACLAWWLIDGLAERWRRPAAVATAIVVAIGAASAARGAYLLTRVADDRQLVRLDLPPTPWTDAMRWLRTQPVDWHVLADPDHGWKYGSSVRVAGERDTVIEAGKDTSMAMYDRAIAMRVRDRLQTLAGFETLSPDAIRAAAARYDADVVIARAGQPLPFPELYRNAGFVVYDLR